MYRFYLGIALCCMVILSNHFDWLFPNKDHITLLGKTYFFTAPFTFSDILWTVIQKLNIIIFAIGSLLAVFGLLSLVSENHAKIKRKSKLVASLALGLVITTYIFQSYKAFVMYVSATKGQISLTGIVLVGLAFIVVLGLIVFAVKKYSTDIKESQHQVINDRLDELSLSFYELIEDYRDVEAISEEMSSADNVEAWKLVIGDKVRKMYNNANTFLEVIEGKKLEENGKRTKKVSKS